MNTVYQIVPLKKRSFLQSLFRQMETEDAIIEINNLLATKPLLEIPMQSILDIASKYKANIPVQFERNIDELYAAYLHHCLKDKTVSEHEAKELTHLQRLLGMTDSKTGKIHQYLASKVYKQTLEETIADGRINEEEKTFLRRLETNLRLSSDKAESINSSTKNDYVKAFIDKILADGRLSPDEERELKNVQKSLDVDIQLNDKTKATFNRYRELWNIENNTLTPIVTDIHLQKTEPCYYTSPVEWYELRAVTQHYNTGSTTARIKIAKGFYYTVGNINTYTHTGSSLKLIDKGQIYLTNKRILFTGQLGNKNIPYGKILSFTPYTDGIDVDKDTGKSPFLKVNGDVEKMSLIFSKLLREN